MAFSSARNLAFMFVLYRFSMMLCAARLAALRMCGSRGVGDPLSWEKLRVLRLVPVFCVWGGYSSGLISGLEDHFLDGRLCDSWLRVGLEDLVEEVVGVRSMDWRKLRQD